MNSCRVLAVHDVSCVGRCSLTAALPIISSLGIECSVLPTAVLSTQTGGFEGYTFRDLTEDMPRVAEHWSGLGLRFDAFYTGFLGSVSQIDAVAEMVPRLSKEGARIYVDPVMGDKGVLYPVLDPGFPRRMGRLCSMADVIMPNLTELCLMLGREYREGVLTLEEVGSMLRDAETLGCGSIVVTGVSLEEGKVGAVYIDFSTGRIGTAMRGEVPGFFHGTGDVFGSALVGAMESGLGLEDAVPLAVDFVVGSIVRANAAGKDPRLGVDFEKGLAALSERVRLKSSEVSFEVVSTDAGACGISSMADSIWREAYSSMISEGQIDYMLGRFLSHDAIVRQMREGYTYVFIVCGGERCGFIAYAPEDGHMFLSKLYIDRRYRGLGLSRKAAEFVAAEARRQGLPLVRLTVNRGNSTAISAYKRIGFRIAFDQDSDIGEGYTMNDHVMDLIA